MPAGGFGTGFSSALGDGGFGPGGFFAPAAAAFVADSLALHLDAGNAASYPGSGATWYDISGNGRNATLYNSPTYSSANGGILTFAKASYQYAATSTSFPSAPNWTVEVWIKFSSTTNAGTNAVVTNVYDGSNLNFNIGTGDVASASIKAGFFNGSWRNTTAGQAVVLGTWYHFVGTYDGSTIRLYRNNTQIGTLSYSGVAASGGAVRIARRWDDVDNVAANFVGGDIPLVRIYSKALSAAEVELNFNSTKGRYGL